MMLAKQIQGYRISFELTKTKPLQSGFVGTMKLIINFLCQLRLDTELMEHVHMKVWLSNEQPITRLETVIHFLWESLQRLNNMKN